MTETVTIPRDVVEQMLRMLSRFNEGRLVDVKLFEQAERDLRDALAAGEARPVAEVCHAWSTEEERIKGTRIVKLVDAPALPVGTKLYAHPPQPAVEARPVAWNWMLDGAEYGPAYYGQGPDADIVERAASAGRTVRYLYAAPPQPAEQPTLAAMLNAMTAHADYDKRTDCYTFSAARLPAALVAAMGAKR